MRRDFKRNLNHFRLLSSRGLFDHFINNSKPKIFLMGHSVSAFIWHHTSTPNQQCAIIGPFSSAQWKPKQSWWWNRMEISFRLFISNFNMINEISRICYCGSQTFNILSKAIKLKLWLLNANENVHLNLVFSFFVLRKAQTDKWMRE